MIYLASYKGIHAGWQGIINRGIRWLTRSQYSHSEVCIGNPFEGPVMCLSSSGVDGGVRFKTMQLSPDKWDIVEMPWVTADDAVKFFQSERGCGYDFAGVTRFALPWLVGPSAKRWFCTETVAAVAGYSEPWRFCPADFHIIVQARLASESV